MDSSGSGCTATRVHRPYEGTVMPQEPNLKKGLERQVKTASARGTNPTGSAPVPCKSESPGLVSPQLSAQQNAAAPPLVDDAGGEVDEEEQNPADLLGIRPIFKEKRRRYKNPTTVDVDGEEVQLENTQNEGPPYFSIARYLCCVKKAWDRPPNKHLLEEVLPMRQPDFGTDPTEGFRFTWLGHATCLVQMETMVILTDPCWSRHTYPFLPCCFRRYRPPPIANIEDLPRVDFVLISHNHYDHLNLDSCQKIEREFGSRGLTWFVPLGLAKWFESKIGEFFGPFDLCALPAGCGEPRQLMSGVHTNVDDAVQMHSDLHSQRSVAIHWGTYTMGAEETFDHVKSELERLAQVHDERISTKQMTTLSHGETLDLSDAPTIDNEATEGEDEAYSEHTAKQEDKQKQGLPAAVALPSVSGGKSRANANTEGTLVLGALTDFKLGTDKSSGKTETTAFKTEGQTIYSIEKSTAKRPTGAKYAMPPPDPSIKGVVGAVALSKQQQAKSVMSPRRKKGLSQKTEKTEPKTQISDEKPGSMEVKVGGK